MRRAIWLKCGSRHADGLLRDEIHDASDDGADGNPEEKVGEEERDTEKARLHRVVKRGIQRGDEGGHKQQQRPILERFTARRLRFHSGKLLSEADHTCSATPS